MQTNLLSTVPGARKAWLLVASIALTLVFAALPQAAFAQFAPPAPDAEPINASTNEDTPVVLDTTIVVDSRYEVQILSQPTSGTATAVAPTDFSASRKINFAPAANQSGVYTFDYRICEIGSCNTNAGAQKTVTVTVNPVNDPPVAVADTATTNQNVPVTINVKANDNAGPGEGSDVTLAAIVAQPSSGKATATVTADGQALYTPTDANYCNTDTNGNVITPDIFTYRITDSGGAMAIGQVRVTVICDAVVTPGVPTLKVSAPYVTSGNKFKVDIILESSEDAVASVDFDLLLSACLIDPDVPTNDGFAGDVDEIGEPEFDLDDVTNQLNEANFFFLAVDEADTLTTTVGMTNTVHFIAGAAAGDSNVLAGPSQVSRTLASIELKSATVSACPPMSATIAFSDTIFTKPNGQPIAGTSASRSIDLADAINEVPTNLELVNTVSIKSDALGETYVGTLQTTDPNDPGRTDTYMYDIDAEPQQPATAFELNPAYPTEVRVISPTVALTSTTYTLTVTTMDNYGGVYTKTIYIVVGEVEPENMAPAAIDDTATVTTTTAINVLANDTDTEDPGCSTCVVESVTQGQHGIVSTDGLSVTYVLTDMNWAGQTDVFEYTIRDGDNTNPKTDTATVTVTVANAGAGGLGVLGDCNMNGSIDAGDLTAIGLEYFDGDGLLWYNAYMGTYRDFNPYGCNSNKDKNIDAGDLTCTVRKIFNNAYVCPTSAVVAAGSSASLAAATVNATAGATVNVPVSLSSQGNAVSGAAFEVTFDANVFEYAGVDIHVKDDLANWVDADDAANGVVRITLVDSSLNPTAFADGTIATLKLTVKGDAANGSSAVSLSESSLGSVDGAEVSVQAVDGAVQIGSVRSIFLPFIGR